MKLKQPEVHKHKFTKKATKSVQLYKEEIDQSTGKPSKGAMYMGKDTLKLLICLEPINGKPCGKYQAYDLERVKA